MGIALTSKLFCVNLGSVWKSQILDRPYFLPLPTPWAFDVGCLFSPGKAPAVGASDTSGHDEIWLGRWQALGLPPLVWIWCVNWYFLIKCQQKGEIGVFCGAGGKNISSHQIDIRVVISSQKYIPAPFIKSTTSWRAVLNHTYLIRGFSRQDSF